MRICKSISEHLSGIMCVLWHVQAGVSRSTYNPKNRLIATAKRSKRHANVRPKLPAHRPILVLTNAFDTDNMSRTHPKMIGNKARSSNEKLAVICAVDVAPTYFKMLRPMNVPGKA